MSTYNDTYSITDLRQHAVEVLAAAQARGHVNVIQNSRKAAVLVNADYFSMLQDAYEELEDQRLFDAHVGEKDTISWEELKKDLALDT
jgi:prevent-host-death family protein